MRSEEPGEAAVAVSGSAMLQLRREVDELRARTTDLTTLAGAISRLARTTLPGESRAAVCEAVATVAGSDHAALIESGVKEGGLLVTSAMGPGARGAQHRSRSELARRRRAELRQAHPRG